MVALASLMLLVQCGNREASNASTPTLTPEAVITHANQPADRSITAAVQRELGASQGLENASIDVRTSEGIVTLDGTVPNLMAKRRAARLARMVRGVRSVINELEVVPVERTDTAILTDVRRALAADPAVGDYGITAEVRRDTVILSGTVDSWTKRRLAENVVRTVRGIHALDNEIEVVADLDRSPSEIELEIEQALRWNAQIDDAQIEVTVEDSTAILTGVVESAHQKALAARESYVRGIETVETGGLRVASWRESGPSRGERTRDLTDTEVETALEEALAQAPRIEPFTIDVSVENRVATLEGVVDNLRAKRSAENIALNTWGVRRVENRITVEPETERLDPTIEDEIRAALERDPYVEADQITVEVEAGIAGLEGEVPNSFVKWQAGRQAASVEGIRSVENQLTVRESPTDRGRMFGEWDPVATDYDFFTPVATDSTLARQIRQQIAWTPVLDTSRIEVRVDGSVATLTGTVDTRQEAQQAVTAAYQGGAGAVRDSLRIIGHPAM